MWVIDKWAHMKLQTAYWATLFLLLAIVHSGHPLNSDEGMVLNGAWNLMNGREPYTDFFEIMTPGSFYVVYWLWELLGPHYFIAKALAVLSVFAACYGIFLTGRLLALNVLSYAGPLLYAMASIAWPIINHNTFNIVLVVWAIYFFGRSLGTASIPGMAASGLTAGISILFLQHKSAVLVLATAGFLVYLWLAEKRSVWLKGLAIYLLCVAVPVMLLLRWPLEPLFESLVYFPLFNYVSVNKVPLWPFLLACLTLLASASLLRGNFNRVAGYLVLVQATLLLITLQRTDYLHVSIALAPLLALLPYLHERAELSSKAVRYFQFLPAIIFLFGFSIGGAVGKLPNMSFFGKKDAPKLIEFIRTHCSETPYLYAGPFMPGLYFETGMLNATSFSVLLTGFNTTQQFDQARKELEIHKPGCIVTNYSITRKFKYERNNPVDELIASSYKLERSFGRPEVYVSSR